MSLSSENGCYSFTDDSFVKQFSAKYSTDMYSILSNWRQTPEICNNIRKSTPRHWNGYPEVISKVTKVHLGETSCRKLKLKVFKCNDKA